ncbi:hypothetical protein [Methylocystis sp. Sn-Cys]|uniref:hypothetical protein n=1 Tax=Methylocystis sp. Sn-Cys TaxID=1701263 RepID=UPI001921C918|nr:hypothetical protein [Methylocystis sp. Sn-Cys]MBL1255680.1 hypothetical protein [Methylocystis sp. Sn-Cys]
MSAFTFEYSRGGETPLLAEKIEISDRAAIWRHVETLALRFPECPGALIRVRDERGQVVVRAGVATALAAIEQCPCGCCELKETARGERKVDDLRRSSCTNSGACPCEAHSAPKN